MLKTHYVLFTTHTDLEPHVDLVINGSSIEQKKHVSFLGIYIDDKLTWRQHIDYVRRKLASAIFALRRMCNMVSQTTLQTVYYALFYPYLDYGLILWGGAAVTNLDKVVKLQKKAIRIIAKKGYNAHTPPIFSDLKILKFNDVCDLQLAKFIYSL